MFLKDYERQVILEGGVVEEDDDDLGKRGKREKEVEREKVPLTYVEEQQRLKEELAQNAVGFITLIKFKLYFSFYFEFYF
jgi:hypothetical protein